MAAIIKDESPELGAKIVSVLIYNGLPATPLEVVNQIFAPLNLQKLHRGKKNGRSKPNRLNLTEKDYDGAALDDVSGLRS